MKQLKKILLINWHYFTFETIELEGINFLTGKNGAGKTTVIDAIQLLILGDTTGHFFNKSASDKSSRTLKGYLRCEIGDDDKGDSVYLRKGRFSSYVAGEFFDDINNEYLTVGVVFDNYEDGSIDYRYFSYDGAFPEHKFVINKVPLSIKELKVHLLEKYYKDQINFFETNVSYREFAKEKFGHLPNSFFGLFKKAIPFSPISNIETFITEYVCDVENTINIETMQENIRNYKKLEQESETIQKRVEELSKIQTIFDEWKKNDEAYLLQKYLYHRSDLQIKSKLLESGKEKITSGKEDLGQYSLLIDKCENEIKNLTHEKDKLVEEKYSLDIFKKKAEIEEKKEVLDNQINLLQEKITNIMYNLDNYQVQWLTSINKVINYRGIEDNSLHELKSLASNYLKRIKNFSEYLNLSEIDLNYFVNIQKDMNNLKDEINGFTHSLKEQLKTNLNRQNEINNLLVNIDKGVKNYDYRLLKLINIIEEKLLQKHQKEIHVSILADLLEVKDPEWKNAIEGYLSSQKFYLIVDPLYFEEALKIYDEVKFEYNLFDYGLIDCEKVLNSKPTILRNSLAEEIISQNKYAKAYIDSLVGSLIKCDRVEELRQHSRSITKTGMIYQGFVARQINKEKWRNHFIGFNSFENERNMLEDEVSQISIDITKLKDAIAFFDDAGKVEVINLNEIKSIELITKEYEVMPSLVSRRDEFAHQIDNLDLSYVEVLEDKINKTNNKIINYDVEKKELLTSQIKLRAELDRLEQFEIPMMEASLKECKETIYSTFNKAWIMATGEPNFMEELDKTKNINTVLNFYKSKLDHIDNHTKDLREQLIMTRSQYNSKYSVSYNPNSNDNKLYNEEYNDFVNQKLVDYREKIQIAKANSIEQFKDDFLAKLKSNFDDVKMQIDSLNSALHGTRFGNDSYEFVISPRSEYKEYYEMIMDPLLMEGYSVGEEVFQDKYKDVIENLFRQITFADTSLDANTRSEIERNIARYTDYRTYLKFDLIVSDSEGRKQHLSKTLLKKSGGETQTPFYISVLASFAQLYRVNDSYNSKNQTIRLIVFDEAFSKMDSERIQESVKLLRSYGLQAILSAPPEKMSDIVPLVDNTICVVRDDQKSFVRNYVKELVI